MTLIDSMIERILNGETSFTIYDEYDSWYKHFITCPIGNALYIYGTETSNVEKLGYTSNKYSLLAIQSNNIFYIVDRNIFHMYYFNKIESNFKPVWKTLEEYQNEINENIKSELYKKFYDEIEIDYENNVSDGMIKKSKKEARDRLINKLPEKEVLCDKDYLFSLNDTAQLLSGMCTIESMLREKITKNKEMLISKKICTTLVNYWMKHCDDIISESEMVLANSINQIDAKYVTVEFTIDDKVNVAKIEPSIILNHIVNCKPFGYWEFNTMSEGKRVMNELGILYKCNVNLNCHHISKITYGKKTLFQKSENDCCIIKDNRV